MFLGKNRPIVTSICKFYRNTSSFILAKESFLPINLFIEKKCYELKLLLKFIVINPSIDLLLTLFKFNCSVN